jgi:hypothetical protein
MWLGNHSEEASEPGLYEENGKEGDDRPGDRDAENVHPKETALSGMAKVLKVSCDALEGDSHIDAQFGEDYRPVPLKKIVKGFDAANNWALGPILDKALLPELLNLQMNPDHKGKPILVFCPTRKSRCMLDYCHRVAG